MTTQAENEPPAAPATSNDIPKPPTARLKRLVNLLNRHRFLIGYIILLISLLPFLPSFEADIHGDVRLYEDIATDATEGTLPYRERTVEYPPYAVPIFLLPGLFGGVYSENFMLLTLGVDIALKLLLLLAGLRYSNGLRSLLPLLFYAVSVPALQHFYLQRYDVWPAIFSALILWTFCSRRFAWSGACLAVGIGVKLYPAVFLPPLLCMAWRQQKVRSCTTGLIAGLLPIALISPFLPWWDFLAFHGARGLQVESIYASILWMAHLLGLAQLEWVYTTAWFEVQGPAAIVLLPYSRVIFVAAVGVSTLAAMAAAMKQQPSIPQLSRLLLMPLLAFIAFNQVLSPQYMIWLLPLAALSSLDGKTGIAAGIAFATWLTPGFYPSPGYGTGLDLFETSLLLYRNLLLIAIWATLVYSTLRDATNLPRRFDEATIHANDVMT